MSLPAGYRFGAIDLPSLKAPAVVEELSFETLLQKRLDRYVAGMRVSIPDFPYPTISDPAYQCCVSGAYSELLLRQRVNDAARAVLLAFATKTNLNHLGANVGLTRLVLDEGDADAIPPIPPTYEEDDDFRRRIALAPEAFSVAGPEGGYIFQGLTAGQPLTLDSVTTPEPGVVTITYRFDPAATAARIKDVSVQTPTPGAVLVTVLSRDGNGTPEQDILDAVTAQLSDQHVRPLGDAVTIQAAQIIEYEIVARLTLYPGPGEAETIASSQSGAQSYADERHALARDVTRSTLFAALNVAGATQKIEIISPSADIVTDKSQAAYCTGITITVEGRDE